MKNSAIASDPNDQYLGEDDNLVSVYEQSGEERDAAERNYARYFYVRGRGHQEYVDRANKCDEFYRGDQWDAQDRKKLEAAGRPVMTVNMILAAVNSVKGEYSNKRADFKFKPKREGATVDQAMVLNKVIMHECDDMSYDDHESDMFDDGIILDRGYIDIRMSTEDNIAGELETKTLDPRHVIPDPDSSNYDPKYWRDVIATEYMSLEEIALKYGEDKAKQIRINVDTLGRYATDSVEMHEDTIFGDEGGSEVGASDGSYYGTTDRASEAALIKSVRVIDRQYWQVGTFKHFMNPEVGDSIPVPSGWNLERAEVHAEQYGLELIERQEKRVRWTVSADKTLLYDDWSPYKSFTIVPFFPNFRRGHPIGMVANLLNPQEIINKTASQVLHIVNTTANSGWIVESGALHNMTKDDLAETGSQTGIVIETVPGGKDRLEKIKPNPVPSGVTDIKLQAQESIYDISGINRAMAGNENSVVSGIALQNRQQRGMLQLQPVFDNLARSRRFVGRKFLELVQGFYTDERVFMISDYTDPDAAPQEMVTNEMVANEEGQGFTVVNDLSIGKYGIAIGTMPARDVYNESQFAEALSLREAGIMIPDHHIISYSNLDKKQEMAEQSKQMQGLAPPTEEEMEMQRISEEVQMQTIQIDLEDRIAGVELKQAQARLAEAKAMEAADTPELEREKLELEITITQIEQATRDRVTRMKELSEQMKNMNNNRAKIEVEKRKIMGNMATQALSNRQEKTTKTKSEK